MLAACQDRPERLLDPPARPTALRTGRTFNECEAQLAPAPTSSRYGVGANALANLGPWDSVSNATYASIATLLRQANVGWVRIDFDWGRVIGADPAARDTARLIWAAIDLEVDRARCRGLNVLGNLAYTPVWAAARLTAVPDTARFWYLPDSLRYWQAFVRAAVERYPEIRHWSVWNEPNTRSFFRGQNDVASEMPADYARLIASAAPYIRGNLDGRGPRSLVALELAAGATAENNRWLQGVLGPGKQGGNVDVVAVHHYGHADDTRTTMYNMVAQSGVSGWPWPLWLTEVGPIGCNDRSYPNGRLQLGYCEGDSLQLIRSDWQSSHLGGVMGHMQNAPASSYWAKTFYWHSHAEVFRAHGKYEGNNYGILSGAGAGQLQGRPTFTRYAQIAGPLALSGATYGYNQPVPVTATPAVPGSYYYVWEYRWCYNGNAPGDCDYQWYRYREGQDVRTISPYLNPQDYWEEVRVRQYAWKDAQGRLGPQLGAGGHVVYGAGKCTDPSGCGGGGGPLRAGADSAAADTASALGPPAKRPPGVRDVVWERMHGHRGRGNG